MSLKYEPSSEPLHISVKQLFLNQGRLPGARSAHAALLSPSLSLSLPLSLSHTPSAPKVDAVTKVHAATREHALKTWPGARRDSKVEGTGKGQEETSTWSVAMVTLPYLLSLTSTCIHTQLKKNYFTEMCSGSEEGTYFRLIDFVYHSTLGLRVIKKKKSCIHSYLIQPSL